PDLSRARHGQLGADQRADALTQDVEAAQPYALKEIADRGRVVLDRRHAGRRVGFAESRQVRRVHRAVASGEGQKAREHPARARAIVQTQQRRRLLEPPSGRDRVVHVQLTITTLEIAAAHARLRRDRAGGCSPAHTLHSATTAPALASAGGVRTLAKWDEHVPFSSWPWRAPSAAADWPAPPLRPAPVPPLKLSRRPTRNAPRHK